MKEEKSIFKVLGSVNTAEHTEKKNGLTYLSWSWAWQYVKENYPDAAYSIREWDGKPYLYDPILGFMVETAVTIQGETLTMWLPVMDNTNHAMKSEPYTYKVYDSYKKQYVDKTVNPASMFDINSALMRCLVKNLAMFGLGLNIYAGEDLPMTVDEVNEVVEEPKKKTTKTNPKPVAPVIAPAQPVVKEEKKEEPAPQVKEPELPLGADTRQEDLIIEMIENKAREGKITLADMQQKCAELHASGQWNARIKSEFTRIKETYKLGSNGK